MRPEIVARFQRPDDAELFRDGVSRRRARVRFDDIVKAIAAFERTLSPASRRSIAYLYRDDRSGDVERALRGMKLFFSDRLACADCHAGFNLSGPVTYRDAAAGGKPTFHNTGLYNVDGEGRIPRSIAG